MAQTMTLDDVLKGARGALSGKVMVPEGNAARYADGVDTGNDSVSVSIGINNVWGANTKDGGCVSSYERIGYHSGSVDFIDGVLSTGCPVVVHRVVNGDLHRFRVVA